MADLIPRAIGLGYDDIVITEHLDLAPREIAVFGVPPLVKYRNHVEHFRKKYPEIRLGCGIEVGDFQDTKALAEPLLKEMQFDLVLGSVHYIRNHINVAIPMRQPLTKQDRLDYYKRNLQLVKTCNIDVLAHLGVYKRYYYQPPDESDCLPVMSEIFQAIIGKNIALEINFSAFRRNYKSLHPETDQLELYRELGGRLVTIGSDAHTLDTFDDHYEQAQAAVARYGFKLLRK